MMRWLAALLFCLFSTSLGHAGINAATGDYSYGNGLDSSRAKTIQRTGKTKIKRTRTKRVQLASAGADLPPAELPASEAAPMKAATQIMPHPAGCPRRLFCGCGVSLYIFGKAVAAGGLAIAREWLRFPRAEPAAGMVAARRGHVFAIVRDLGHGRVLAYDPNSGNHKTRIHVRSLRGYVVVNPHGTKQASAS